MTPGRSMSRASTSIYPAQYRDPAWRDSRERPGELSRAEFANRRFATLVHRDALIYGRPVFRELVHVPAERLERAAVARGAPRFVPAAARIVAGPGGLRDDAPRSFPAAAGPGGLHQVSPHEIAPRAAGPGMLHGEAHGNPAAAPQRAWQEHPNSSAAVARPEAHPFARPEPAGQHMPREFRPPEGYHPTTAGPQYGRPEVPRMTASGQQFGRPEAFHTPVPTYNAGATAIRAAGSRSIAGSDVPSWRAAGHAPWRPGGIRPRFAGGRSEGRASDRSSASRPGAPEEEVRRAADRLTRARLNSAICRRGGSRRSTASSRAASRRSFRSRARRRGGAAL